MIKSPENVADSLRRSFLCLKFSMNTDVPYRETKLQDSQQMIGNISTVYAISVDKLSRLERAEMTNMGRYKNKLKNTKEYRAAVYQCVKENVNSLFEEKGQENNWPKIRDTLKQVLHPDLMAALNNDPLPQKFDTRYQWKIAHHGWGDYDYGKKKDTIRSIIR